MYSLTEVGGQKSKIKVCGQGHAPSEGAGGGSVPGPSLDFQCCFGLCVCESVYLQMPPLYKDTGQIGLGPTLLQNGLILIISAMTSFPNKVVFRGTGG